MNPAGVGPRGHDLFEVLNLAGRVRKVNNTRQLTEREEAPNNLVA
jgi:hypothetical protein